MPPIINVPKPLPYIFLLLAVLLASQPADAKNKRSSRARAEFMQATPCPATGEQKGRCPGYVIDHIKPLACGGEDAPHNMQWQPVQEAKAKDRWERRGCNL